MVPGVEATAPATPSLPRAPSPTPPANCLPAPPVHAPSEAASRYCWKLSVVPDSSERKITLIGWSGSSTPSFSAAIAGAFQDVVGPVKMVARVQAGGGTPAFAAAIAGSFQEVMVPLKVLARVSPESATSTPSRLYATAIGPNTAGRFHAGPSHRSSARAYSSPSSGESEPPKSVCPPMNSETPAPEPLEL